jgi:hypothetical protein
MHSSEGGPNRCAVQVACAREEHIADSSERQVGHRTPSSFVTKQAKDAALSKKDAACKAQGKTANSVNGFKQLMRSRWRKPNRLTAIFNRPRVTFDDALLERCVSRIRIPDGEIRFISSNMHTRITDEHIHT